MCELVAEIPEILFQSDSIVVLIQAVVPRIKFLFKTFVLKQSCF